MQVRKVTAGEWASPRLHNGMWMRTLRVEGRRYKPSGELGSPPATAEIHASDLPADVWQAIKDEVPFHLHPQGD